MSEVMLVQELVATTSILESGTKGCFRDPERSRSGFPPGLEARFPVAANRSGRIEMEMTGDGAVGVDRGENRIWAFFFTTAAPSPAALLSNLITNLNHNGGKENTPEMKNATHMVLFTNARTLARTRDRCA